jgi:hypothetical protein
VFTGWLFALAVAGAEPPPWLEVVREQGAESCPDARALGAAVEAELGRTVPGPRVRCVVGREGRAWRARIAIDDGQRAPAARTIRAEGSDCRALASALELTLSLALSQPPPPAPEPGVPQVSDGEMPEALVARPAPARGPWSLSGGAVVSAGALLDLSTGLEVGGRWRRGRLLLAFEGRGERAPPARQGPATVDGWRASAAFVPCLAPGPIQVCGVGRVGGFTARGERLAPSRAGRGVVAEAGARAAWLLGRDDLAAALYLEAAAPLVRTRLLVDGQPRWESPPVVVTLGLAVVLGR